MRLLDRIDLWATRAMVSLPTPVVRRLAGRPVVVDGHELAADVQLALRVNALTMPDIPSVPVPRGRRIVLRQAAAVGGRFEVGAVRDLEVAGLPARHYAPTRPSTALLLYFHGGAFVYGDLDSHDGVCRFLCEEAGVQVLAVDYRLAPEHPFPAAHDDAVAAHRWLVEHAAEFDVTPDRISVGGDSAGANLSIHVALSAARDGLPLAHQLLFYPATENAERDTRSSRIFDAGYYLSREFMVVGTESYTPDPADRPDPRISPLRAEFSSQVAPALLVAAGYDPLRDEGEALGERMRTAGVDVEHLQVPDQVHAFLNMLALPCCRAAAERIARVVRERLA